MTSFKCLSSVTIMSSAPAHGTTCSDQWLKLTPSKSTFSQSISPISPSQSHSHTRENTTTTTTVMKTDDDCNMKIEKAEEDTGEGGGSWSFLQCLTNNNNNNNTTNKNKEASADCNEKVYVHPLVKRSSSMLSEKSLEMCTESLGSETGSLVSESSDDDDVITGINNNYSSTNVRENNLVKKRTSSSSPSFPPPLTSISSSNSVQVRPHREGGRLVLQAVTVPSSPPTYFQAERSDGRLRLCLVKDIDCVPNEEDQEEEEEEEEELAEEVDDKEDEDEDEYCCCDDGEDEEGENENDRGEIGIENLTRRSRCNDGGREEVNRLIWDTFWVAT